MENSASANYRTAVDSAPSHAPVSKVCFKVVRGQVASSQEDQPERGARRVHGHCFLMSNRMAHGAVRKVT